MVLWGFQKKCDGKTNMMEKVLCPFGVMINSFDGVVDYHNGLPNGSTPVLGTSE